MQGEACAARSNGSVKTGSRLQSAAKTVPVSDIMPKNCDKPLYIVKKQANF